MITKEATINGKQVTLGYCYATEIAFREMADIEMSQFIQSVINDFNAEPKGSPNVKTIILAIIASAMAYYQSRGEESPITDKELMFEGDPTEIGNALGHIIVMYAQFYKVDGLVEEQKPKGKRVTRKNA